ncbi:unnamed protein product [Linum trigynum]|uniref:Uncharacterized protein n=1 Tax=Linum trigynum TaxID=586398 RepID=A0AAV2FS21_9ROSI
MNSICLPAANGGIDGESDEETTGILLVLLDPNRLLHDVDVVPDRHGLLVLDREGGGSWGVLCSCFIDSRRRRRRFISLSPLFFD